MAVIPSGTSEPWFWLAREAAANDALARMYHQLGAKREDRKRAEALAMKMFELRNREWDRRRDVTNPEGPDYQTGNPMYGPGGAANRGSDDDAAAPSGTTGGSGAKTMPGGVPILTPGAFTKTSAMPGGDSFAQADDNDTLELSSQNVRPSQRDRDTYKPRTGSPTNTQLPKQPSKKQRQNQAMFLPIPEHVHQAMDIAEKKYGLPSGTMLTTLGLENGGGRVWGKNPNSSATGWYQFTEDLRKTYNISEADTQNVIKMTDLAARNMRRNAMQLENSTRVGNNPGIKLGNSVADIPAYLALHMYGSTDGPLVVAAMKKNPGMLMKDVMFQKPNRDNARVLIKNKIPGDATVADAMGIHIKRLSPWMYSAIELQDARKRGAAPQVGPQTQAPADATELPPQQTVDGAQPPRPPANIPPDQGSRGANPRLVRAIRGGAEMALPEGYTLRQTSGHRPGDSGYHGRRQAADFRIIKPDGTAIPNQGPDTTGLYTKLARGTKTWIQENDPSFRANWGGAHSTKKRGGNVSDIMHFDTGPDRGRLRPDLRMSRLQLLSAEERRGGQPQQTAQAPKQQQQVAQAPADWEKLPSVATDRNLVTKVPKSAPIVEASNITAPYADAMSATAAVNPQQQIPMPRPRPNEASPPPAPIEPDVPLPRPRDASLGSDADAGAFDEGGSLGSFSEDTQVDVPLPRPREGYTEQPSMRAMREGPSEPTDAGGGYTSAETMPEPQTQANVDSGGIPGLPDDGGIPTMDVAPIPPPTGMQARRELANRTSGGFPSMPSMPTDIAARAKEMLAMIQQGMVGAVPEGPPAPSPTPPTQPTPPMPANVPLPMPRPADAPAPTPVDVPLPQPRPPSAPTAPAQPVEKSWRQQAIEDKEALIAAIFGKKGAATSATAKPTDPNVKRVKTERFDRDMVSKDRMPDGTPYINPNLKIIIDPKPKAGIPDMGIKGATEQGAGTMPSGASGGSKLPPPPVKRGMPLPGRVDPNNPNEVLIEVPDVEEPVE